MFKILLIIVLSVLTLAIAVTGYFFYKLTLLQQVSVGVVPVATTTVGGHTSSAPSMDEQPVDVGEFSVPATGFVIQIGSLPEGQQTAARAMGFTDTIVITPEAIACATDRIGQDRVAAIGDGASPTLMESVALLGCI